MLAKRVGAVVKVIPVDEQGVLDMEAYQALLSPKTKLVAIVHVSNALGTINPVKEITAIAHEAGALVLVDGAQSSPHMSVNVQELDCDFFVFSAHKVYGPTGIGILYGKRDLLLEIPPFLGGGEMIQEVDFAGTTYNELPYKFEAGTPNIADTIALRQALQFVTELGTTFIADQEHKLLVRLTKGMKALSGIKLWGQAAEKAGVLSFTHDTIHHFDLGMMLDARGFAIRTGHHCTQPLMKRYGLDGTARASFAVYNTEEEVDRFLESLQQIIQKFG